MTEMHLDLNRPDTGSPNVGPIYVIQIEGDNQAYGPYSYDTGKENPTREYVGGTIMDFGSLKKDNSGNWNYEVPNTLDFTKYLCINQGSVPYDKKRFTIRGKNWDVRRWSSKDLLGTEIEDHFPVVTQLKEGFKQPVILDENSYISIDCAAIYERYFKRDYINPDWTKENTGIGGIKAAGIGISETGMISEVGFNNRYNAINTNSVILNLNHPEKWEYIITDVPHLHLQLGVGNKYWNGEQWVTGKRSFRLKLSTPTDDDGKISMEDWWNTDHKVLNNISWTEYGGIAGYKIPLDPSLDLSQEIHFAILLPSKIQEYHGEKYDSGYNLYGDTGGFSPDGYCWIKDFKVEFATKGAENVDNSDIVYENVMMGSSINELPDITCKITTYPGEGLLSYSNVGYKGRLLEGVAEGSINGTFQKPEQNIVEKYYMQYATPTKVENLSLKNDFMPWCKVNDPYFDTNYRILGQTIDYAENRQDVTMMEIKYSTPVTGDTNFLSIERVDSSDIISGTGGYAQIRILSNRPWTATTPSSSVSIPITEGTGVATATTQMIGIGPNNQYGSRTFVITVRNDKDMTATLSITQAAGQVPQNNAPYINSRQCVTCGACAIFDGDDSIFADCPFGVGPIEFRFGVPYIANYASCAGCSACLNNWSMVENICPTEAITRTSI